MGETVELARVRGIENVDAAGLAKIVKVARAIGVPPSDLAAAISFETAGSFDPAQKNLGGGSAIGLIQFMPPTARHLGTTSRDLAAMTFVEQMDYVQKYFKPLIGRLRNVRDLYMGIFAPIGVGKDPSFRLPYKGRAYEQNKGLDRNKDGSITVGEASQPVTNILWAARSREPVMVDMDALPMTRGRVRAPEGATYPGGIVTDTSAGLKKYGLAAAAIALAVALIQVVQGRR